MYREALNEALREEMLRDETVFVLGGGWIAGERETPNFENCAGRTARWRFVNNKQLYDISADPYETTDVSDAHPEVVKQLRQSYDQWWQSVLALMVNEGLPKVKNHPLHIRYNHQLETKGIPEWFLSDL